MRFRLLISTLSLISVSGCGIINLKSSEPPQMGSLIHNLKLVDANGVQYGHVELDPLGGGGRMFDASGKLIGRIVLPEEPKTAAIAPAQTQAYPLVVQP